MKVKLELPWMRICMMTVWKHHCRGDTAHTSSFSAAASSTGEKCQIYEVWSSGVSTCAIFQEAVINLNCWEVVVVLNYFHNARWETIPTFYQPCTIGFSDDAGRCKKPQMFQGVLTTRNPLCYSSWWGTHNGPPCFWQTFWTYPGIYWPWEYNQLKWNLKNP